LAICSQFHQQFISSFFEGILLPKNTKPNFKKEKAVQNNLNLMKLSCSKMIYFQKIDVKFTSKEKNLKIITVKDLNVITG